MSNEERIKLGPVCGKKKNAQSVHTNNILPNTDTRLNEEEIKGAINETELGALENQNSLKTAPGVVL